jgi:excisionase family DNA binding protein
MIIVQLNSEELIELIQNSVREAMVQLPLKTVQSENQSEKLFTIQQAAEFLNLTVPTMYCKVHKREIPFMKRSKRLYFSQSELLKYIQDGRKCSNEEINLELESFLSSKKGLKNGK